MSANVKDYLGLISSVASFDKEVNSRLAKRPLVFNGCLANWGLPSLVKKATGDCPWKTCNEFLQCFNIFHWSLLWRTKFKTQQDNKFFNTKYMSLDQNARLLYWLIQWHWKLLTHPKQGDANMHQLTGPPIISDNCLLPVQFKAIELNQCCLTVLFTMGNKFQWSWMCWSRTHQFLSECHLGLPMALKQNAHAMSFSQWKTWTTNKMADIKGQSGLNPFPQ